MKKKLITYFSLFILLVGCTPYVTPPRENWSEILLGASFGEMTDTARIAKMPVYLGSGGTVLPIEQSVSNFYSENLEHDLYTSLSKAGISVQRAGSEVMVIIVRDAFMETNVAEISADGADTLEIIAKILNKYNSGYIEISGYVDKMTDQRAAGALTLDMAERVAIALVENNVNPVRMFIIGRGSARPIAGQDDIGRLMNRRVEIRISPVINEIKKTKKALAQTVSLDNKSAAPTILDYSANKVKQ